jgi:quinol monooxygenase YgiN
LITFIANVRVKPDKAEAFEALMTDVRALTHANEPGVAYYEWSKSVTEPNLYLVVEVYRDVPSHEIHMASPWVKDSLPISAAMMDGRPDIKQYVNGGSEPVRSSSVFAKPA